MAIIKNQRSIMSLTIYLSIFIALVMFSGLYLHAKKNKQNRLTEIVNYHNRMIREGSISSLVTLGEMYERGEGVKKDLLKAQDLFKKAINYGQVETTGPIDDNTVSSKFTKNTKTNTINSNQQITNKSSYLTKTNWNSTPSATTVKKSHIASDTITFKKNKHSNISKPDTVNKTTINRETKKETALITNSTKTIVIKNKPKKAVYVNTKNKSTKINASKNISKTKLTSIKKSKTPTTAKKISIKAKIPTPYIDEYENDLNDYDENDEPIIAISDNEQVLITDKNNFTSNPCKMSSARYIAKCRRKTRK